MTAHEHGNELDEEYSVGEEVVERFHADGFVKLAGVLSAAAGAAGIAIAPGIVIGVPRIDTASG